MMDGQTDYAALKAYGFSPAKAQEIVLAAIRGDPLAAQLLDHVRTIGQPVKAADQ